MTRFRKLGAGVRRVPTGHLDILLSGQPIWVIAGPMTMGGREDITAGLLRFSAGDPRRRLGLIPTPDSRAWPFDPGSLRSAVVRQPSSTATVENSADGVTAALSSIMNSARDIRVPVAIIPTGEFVVFRFDHGLGDAHIMTKIIAEVSRSSADSYLTEADSDVSPVRNPAIWSVLNAATARPKSLLAAARTVLREKAARVPSRVKQQLAPRADATAGSEPYCAVFVRGSGECVAGIGRYRTEHQLDMSTSAVLMYLVCRSLRASGISLSPVIEVLVDLRRYLPRGRLTWANFTAVARVENWPDTTPQEFGETLATHLASTRPLIEMVGGVAKSRLLWPWIRRRRDGDWLVPERSSTGEATVVFSDITRLPAMADVRWARDGRPNFAVALPPASKSNISILMCAPSPGEIQLTASFFPDEFDPEAVRWSFVNALQEAGCDDPLDASAQLYASRRI